MIDLYDLYDLHCIIVNIRFAPKNKINGEVLACVINVLKMGPHGDRDSHQIRKAIHNIIPKDELSLYTRLLTENTYSYNPLGALKDFGIYAVLTEACEELLTVLHEGDNQKIYDLADVLHDLPVFIVENSYHIPRKFWKNEVKWYRKKWNRNFLRRAEKNITLR